ncbi:MAG: 2,3-bisphosphoglycerate-independent phosphoglycerate mutase [Anaerolineaceae bacterium]|nr:2,3-bisphosphoglycerate-independent phosphoglycerate mutase [Anaerolineaceae bacterium]
MDEAFLLNSIQPAQTKMVMLILDGLGGLPEQPGGKTELETAKTPNLDALAFKSSLGLSVPIQAGITTGSGPGHLAIFGYDPIPNEIGRGAMEALGVGFEMGPEDVAARANFCSVDESGLVIDRRAGRIPTKLSLELLAILKTIRVESVEIFLEANQQHRFAFIMRGPDLKDALTETDPLKTGAPTLPVRAKTPESERAASIANQFIDQARHLLKDKHPANMIMLRGFAKLPTLPSYAEKYGLHAAAIAVNGMYRGVAKLAGMTVLPVDGETIADEFTALEKNWAGYDFFYVHVKQTDTAGENGDFAEKVRVIEEVDGLMPRVMALNPDVVIVSGDHSSPAVLGAHSWHPVPTLLYSKYVRSDGIAEFGERSCLRGSLGTIPAKHIMPIALANAMRIRKYSA